MTASNTNNWLFSSDPNKRIYESRDHMSKERRNLLNQHLDGILSKSELQEKLRELRDANDKG